MRIKKLILFFVVTIFLVGCQTVKYAETSSMDNKYYEIAKKKNEEFGLDVGELTCQDITKDWNAFLKKGSKNDLYPELVLKLADKDFVAIHCGTKDINILGGTISVFIDRETDEIIDVLIGQ